jgi:hypothetical protein
LDFFHVGCQPKKFEPGYPPHTTIVILAINCFFHSKHDDFCILNQVLADMMAENKEPKIWLFR